MAIRVTVLVPTPHIFDQNFQGGGIHCVVYMHTSGLQIHGCKCCKI